MVSLPSGPTESSPTQAAPVVRVRRATVDDLSRTASWQLDHLPHGFFPSLGRRFVERWHATHLATRHGVALVAETTDATGAVVPVGYLVGATDQSAHVRDVLEGGRGPLVRAAATGLVRRPRTGLRFARTRLRPYARRLLGRRTATTGATDPAAGAPVAVVAAVVVVPSARGRGVGEALLVAAERHARAAGAVRLVLQTATDNAPAQRLYRRAGWTVDDAFVTFEQALAPLPGAELR